MAYDEKLVERIHLELGAKSAITERRMFGGVAFLCHGHMFVGVNQQALMARVGKVNYVDSLKRKHVREMDFTGKPMMGYVFVDSEGIKAKAQLQFWLDRALAFVSTLPPKVKPAN